MLVTDDLVYEKSAEENECDTDKVHESTDPRCIGEECACEQGDNGELCTAGHESGQHCGCTTLTLITDGTAGHDARDAAAGADDEGDDRLAGQADLLEDGVENDSCTSHVAANLKQRDEEVHDHDER